LHAVAVLIGASPDRRCTSIEASDRYEPDQQRRTNKDTGNTSDDSRRKCHGPSFLRCQSLSLSVIDAPNLEAVGVVVRNGLMVSG
ncbi:MAG: hypothetical protein AABZ12_14840, partial [Planctomycetota bacterium]